MRILHTSDLHLGRSFYGFDIHAAQAAMTSHLIATARGHEADLVVIAGDVYDRAIPGPAAVGLFDSLLSGLRAAGVSVLATSGNHDSFMRLGFGSGLLDSAGVHLRTRLHDILKPVLFSADGRPAGVQHPAGVAVYGIPYLEPALVAERFGVARTHASVLGHALDLVGAHHRENHPDARLVVAAHAFVAGGAVSESERAIDVGGVGVVPADAFAGADYAALGHLHRPQRPSPTVRYAGSPMPYSFGEGPKQLLLIDLDSTGPARVSELESPEFLQVRTLTGTLDEVLARADPDSLVEARLTNPTRVPQALARLRDAFPRLVRFDYTSLTQDPARRPRQPAARRGDEEVFADFAAEVTGAPPDFGLRELFADALVRATQESS